jgi:hypothetical protein
MSTSMSQTTLATASSAADALIDGRIVPNTKKRYESLIKVMRVLDQSAPL